MMKSSKNQFKTKKRKQALINGNHNENVCIKFVKLSKINDQSSVAIEAGKQTYHKREMSNLPKLNFPFLISFNSFSFNFQLRKILKAIKETYFGQKKINDDNYSLIHKTYQNNLPNFYCNRS